MADELTTYFPTGNASRDGLILQAIMAAEPNATTAEVYEHIPTLIREKFGDLLPEEVSECRRWLAAQAQPAAVEELVEPQVKQQVEPAVELTVTRAEIQTQIRDLENELIPARGELLHLQETQRRMRAVVAQRVIEWQTKGRPPMTREELVREHIKSEQQRKADIAEGRIEPPRRGAVGRSAVDQMAAATAGGNFRAGGGLAFRRGATTQRGRRVRLPSER
jgi:hypothetical protein